MKMATKLLSILLALTVILGTLPVFSVSAEPTVQTDLSKVEGLDEMLLSDKNIVKGFTVDEAGLVPGSFTVTKKNDGSTMHVKDPSVLTNGSVSDTHTDIAGIKFVENGQYVDAAADFTFMLPYIGLVEGIVMAGSSESDSKLFTEEYEIYVGNDPDELYTAANLKYTYQNAARTSGQYISFGTSYSGQYVGIRVTKGVRSDCGMMGDYNPSDIRMREIAVIGDIPPVLAENSNVITDISAVSDLSSKLTGTENITKDYGYSTSIGEYGSFNLTHNVAGEIENIVFDTETHNPALLTNGNVTENHIDLKPATLTAEGEYGTDWLDITFNFPGEATVNAALLAGINSTLLQDLYIQEFAIFASDNLKTLYAGYNKKAQYIADSTKGSNAQYLTFDAIKGAFFGIRIYKAAHKDWGTANWTESYPRLREVALFGSLQIDNNLLCLNAAKIADAEEKLGTDENLFSDYQALSATNAPGSFTMKYKSGAAFGASGANDTSFKDGNPNTHSDLSSAVFMNSNKQPIEGNYFEITANLRYQTDISAIYLSWPTSEQLRAYSYDIYLSNELATLYNEDNKKFSFVNETHAQKQIFNPKGDSAIAKYVGLRITCGVIPQIFTHSASLSYARLAELAVIGTYNTDYYDYTVTDTMNNTIDSGNKYNGKTLSHSVPLVKDGKSFTGFTLNGDDCENTVIDRIENTATVDWTLLQNTGLKANYEDINTALETSKFTLHENYTIIKVPYGTVVYELKHGFTAYPEALTVKNAGNEVEPETLATPDTTVTVADEEYNVVIDGDISEDGLLTVTDLTTAVDEIITPPNMGSVLKSFAADMTGDGNLTVGDAVRIRNAILNPDEKLGYDYAEKTIFAEDLAYKFNNRKATKEFNDKDGILRKAVYLESIGSGIEFNAYCFGDVTLDIYLPGGGDRWVTVEVDGVETELYIKNGGYSTIYLARGLDCGYHTFKINRQLEASYELIFGVTLNGSVVDAPEAKDMLIEFVGDSITCGEGNLVIGGGLVGRHIDGNLAYSVLTAKKLNADYSIVSRGGHCLVYRPGSAYCILDKYEQVAYSNTDPYTFEHKADIVVINLGTNDYGAMEAMGYDTTQKKKDFFKSELLNFVERVKEKNGNDVKIVFALGMMTDPEHPCAQAYDEVAAESETDNLYYCPLPKDLTGGGYHPYMTGHEAASNTLTEFIKTEVLK